MPKVSVILLSYNHEKYLTKAIESILGQTFKDFELIVIDDFSKDASAKIINDYAQKDNRIRCLFHESNQGIAKSLNEGISISGGEYIAYADSDDIWEKERLEVGVEIMDRSPDVGLLHSESIVIDAEGRPAGQRFSSIYPSHTGKYSGNLFSTLLRGNFVCGSSLLVRRVTTEGIHFNKELKYLNDWLYCLEVSEKNRFYYVSHSLVRYRVHEGNTRFDTLGYAADNLLMLKIIFEKYPEHIKKDREILAELYFGAGCSLCSSGQVKQGRKCLLKSVMISPLHVKAVSAALVSLTGSTWIYNTMTKVYRQAKKKL
ncbi:glycosyltransferase [Chloroflexota bacterium]